MSKQSRIRELLRSKPNTFQDHLDQPDVDLTTYTRQKRLELGNSLLSKRRIYLDTKHWIHLRDVLMRRSTKPLHGKIFELLSRRRLEDELICPISYSVFKELLRQSDMDTRHATAVVIDKFGAGCCVQPPNELMKREVMHFVHRTTLPSAEAYPLAQMVWTKLAFVLGDHFLEVKEVPRRQGLAMEKAMDDLFWSMSLEEVVSLLPQWSPVSEEDLQAVADELTRCKMAHKDEFETFEAVFLHEVAGILHSEVQMFDDLLLYLTRKNGGEGDVTTEQVERSGQALANVIHCDFEKERISTELPGIHVWAALHAAVRHDRKRKYKPGDCEDFRHARVALPYYDVFCTENSLKHLICTKPLRLDKVYNTIVVSDDEELLATLSCD